MFLFAIYLYSLLPTLFITLFTFFPTLFALKGMETDKKAFSVRRRAIALIVGNLICAVAIMVVRVRFAGPEEAIF